MVCIILFEMQQHRSDYPGIVRFSEQTRAEVLSLLASKDETTRDLYERADLIRRNLALQRGANIFMPNDTPIQHRKDYLLYPGKPCVDETADHCAYCVLARIEALGRTAGEGPGHSVKQQRTRDPKSQTIRPGGLAGL
jgi:hypothetical protein